MKQNQKSYISGPHQHGKCRHPRATSYFLICRWLFYYCIPLDLVVVPQGKVKKKAGQNHCYLFQLLHLSFIKTRLGMTIHQCPCRSTEACHRKEVAKMLHNGIIELTSNWFSPIVVVAKTSRTIKLRNNLRRLSQILELDANPLP